MNQKCFTIINRMKYNKSSTCTTNASNPQSIYLAVIFDHMKVVLLSFLCRMYGRAPKMIHLEANFVHFKEELLPKKGNKALLTFPFLHIYWTDCCVSS